MILRRQLALTALLAALVAAVLLSLALERLRDRDRRAMLVRVAEGHLTDVVREACEADPVWFLAGPRGGRPTAAQRAMPDADVYLPRPASDELPFEVFAYDGQFEAGSSAAPRFPADVRRQLRGLEQGYAFGAYDSLTGEGLDLALITGWSPGPCAVLLFRLRPEPRGFAVTAIAFVTLLAAGLAVVAVTTARTEWRLRRLAGAARESARTGYATLVPVSGRDEVGSFSAGFNAAAVELKRRGVDAREREEALQRHARHAADEVAAPLRELEARLGALSDDASLDDRARHELRRTLIDAHHLVARLENLAAVVRLRSTTLPGGDVDLPALVGRLVEGRRALARAMDVDVTAAFPTVPVTHRADATLVERAVANVLDNALLNNRPGGHVRVELKRYERGGRFALTVSDDGPGVSDETFAALTANRRFRGDEGRSGRPGRGLGLAVAREVADRFGLQLELRRPQAGGLEVEFAVR